MSAVLPLNAAPRRRWPLLALALAVIAIGTLFAAWNLLQGVNPMPIHVLIDGDEVVHGFDMASLPPAHKVVGALVIGVLMLAAIVIVPMALILVAMCVVAVVAVVIGLPLLAVTAVLAILLSPIWLLGWLVWKALAG